MEANRIDSSLWDYFKVSHQTKMNNSSEGVNTTQASPQVCSSTNLPVAITWFTILLYLLLVILALFGNALVIWVVYKYKRMRTAPNVLIVNMAVGDLLMATLNMIPTVVGMFKGTNSWFDGPFGQASCKFLLFAQASSIACSIFSLTVLAFERFFVAVLPLLNIITIKGTLRLVIVIWVATFAFSSPFVYAAKVRLSDDGVAFCIEDWAPAFNPKRAQAIYTIVAFVFLYALPLLIIAVLYSLIAAKVWSRPKLGNTSPANRRVLHEYKKIVLKMSVAVVLAFALCWLLMLLRMFLMDFSDVFEACGIPKWLTTTGFLLGHANSAINCCIYPIFSQEYRRGFKQSLKSLCWKHARSTPQTDHKRKAADIPLEGQMAN